jgi:hypothetical protein
MNIWYIDSGATDHFIGSKSSFITYKDVEPFPITLSDESTILIRGKGTIILATKPELKVQLNNVLYSPQFRNASLLSIPKIIQAGGDIHFSKGNVHIIDDGTAIATGTYNSSTGLYQLDQFGSGHALKSSKSDALVPLSGSPHILSIKEHVKGVSLLNPASQLYRRLVGTAAESDDGSTDDSDNPDTDYGDTIIVDTENQQLDDPLENDGENHSDAEGGAAENASRDAIGGVSDLSKPPEPLFREINQEPTAPTGAPEQGSTSQEAPKMDSFRGRLLPRSAFKLLRSKLGLISLTDVKPRLKGGGVLNW